MEGVVEIPKEGSQDDIIKAVVENVKWQMEEDRKTTALKQLQGHIWREGYKTGNIKAEYVIKIYYKFIGTCNYICWLRSNLFKHLVLQNIYVSF